MNALRNNKYIGWVVISLAILNVVLLVFIWSGQNRFKKGRPQGGIKLLEERLELDESQKAQLLQLRDIHFKSMESFRKESREARKALHSLWSEANADDKVLVLTQRLGDAHAAIEKATYDHFAQIRAICSPEQQATFDELIEDVLRQGEQSGPRDGKRPLPNDRRPGEGPPPRDGR